MDKILGKSCNPKLFLKDFFMSLISFSYKFNPEEPGGFFAFI